MNRIFVLLAAVSLAAATGFYGCGGSSGSSSTEMIDTGGSTGGDTGGGLTVSLTSSQQGTAGSLMDVNGDGWADQVVTAPYASSSPQKGAVLIYFGSAVGFSSVPYELKGESSGDSFGYSFADIGDMNGDGVKDFAVAALAAEGDAALSGAVYVYSGGNTPALLAKLNGEDGLDKFGWSIAAGDVNNDGKRDVIVGAIYASGVAYQGGAIYIYAGNGNGTFASPVEIHDTGSSKGLGTSIAVGDINNDGIDDILAGESAMVLVWYGKSDIGSLSFSSPSVKIYGVPGSSYAGKYGSGFGKAVAVVGDVDGDGINDFVIGNPNRSDFQTYDNIGAIYVFKGSASLPSTLYIPDLTDASGGLDSGHTHYGYLISKVKGQSDQDRFGSFILPVGDVTGMGTNPAMGNADFLVTSIWGDTDMVKGAGKVYLFSGEHLSAMKEMDAMHAERQFSGETTGSGFGSFISYSGGVIFIGAPLTGQNTGSVYMFSLADGTSVTGGGTTGSGTSSGGVDCH